MRGRGSGSEESDANVSGEIARRLGEETRRETGQRCDFRRGGDGGVGFGECDLLKFDVHDGVLGDIEKGLDESTHLIHK